MAKTTHRFLTKPQLISALETTAARAEKQGQLPLQFEFDGEMLILIGTNNIGQPDHHNIVRIQQDVVYDGAIDVQGHLHDVSLRTRGEEGDIRIKGYVAGSTEQRQARIVAEKGAIIVGDPGHPERKLIMYAHIESGNGVNIYKRQIVHSTVLNHHEDAIIRGQNILHSIIESPSLNINSSLMQHTKIKTIGDAMLKCSDVANCHITAVDGDIYLCTGSVRNSIIEAKYDIELNGAVDEFTLRNARSEKGTVRHDGVEVGRQAAPRRAAAKKSTRKLTASTVAPAARSARGRKTGS